MSISGPCFCPIKNGRPFNKYELVWVVKTPKGVKTTKFYLRTLKGAELYLQYLQQLEGKDIIEAALRSTRVYKWEKDEYKRFMEEIDWETLPNAVKRLKVITETTFVETRINNE